MTSANKLGIIVAVAVVVIFVGLGVGMSNVTPESTDISRPGMEQQAMAPKIIESSSKEKILKEKDVEFKAKLDDKKIPTKLHKVSKDLKDKKIKLTSKLSPEIKERVKMTMDTWKVEKMIPLESVKPSTEKYFGECISDPPPRLYTGSSYGTDWRHCDISYLEFYGRESYEEDDPYYNIHMINSNATQTIFYNFSIENIFGKSTDLTLSTFTNTSLVNADFEHSKIAGIHFINSYLEVIKFDSTNCNEIITGTSDYYPCIFENVFGMILAYDSDWKNIHILDSTLYLDFSGVVSELSIIDSFLSVYGAGIYNNINTAGSFLEIYYTDEAEITNMKLTDSIAKITFKNNGTLNGIEMDNSVLILESWSTDINNMIMSDSHGDPIDSYFDGIDTTPDYEISILRVNGGSMNNVVIENSDLYIDANETEMNNVEIIDSVLHNPNFQGVDLSTTDLSGTEIIDGTFIGVTTGDAPLGCTGHPICD